MATDEQLNRLLGGRDRMSRIDKERVFEDVYAGLESPAQSPGRRRTWLVAALAGAAAIAVIAPIAWMMRSGGEGERITRRGSGAPSFALRCGARVEVGPCAPGDTLVFDVGEQSPGQVSFASFAQRQSDGAIIWYFPATDRDRSIDLARHTERGLVNMGVVLGVEHEPGSYRVFGVFSSEPMTRSDVKRTVEADAPDAPVTIVTRDLVIR